MSADPLAGGGAGAAAVAGAAAGAPGAGAAAAPVPYYADLIGKDGTLNHGAFERLPENLRPLAPSLANIKTTDQLFEKISHLNALAGRKGLAPLPADAKPEDIAAQQAILRAVNGVPEKAEGYSFKRPDDLPETAWNDNHAKAAQELLHKHNASPALAKDLLALQVQLTKENLGDQQKYVTDFFAAQDQEFRTALQKEGLDYDKTMGLIEQTALRFGMSKDDQVMKNAGVRLMLVLAAAFWLISAHTPFGRHLYAIGGNRDAAFYAGIPIRGRIVAAFTLMGVVAAAAGLLRVAAAAGRLAELFFA